MTVASASAFRPRTAKLAGAFDPRVFVVVVGRLALHHLERILVAAGHEIGIAQGIAGPRLVVRVEPDRAVGQFRPALGLTEGARPAKVIGENPQRNRD